MAALSVSSIHVALGSTGFAFSATADLNAGGSAPNISGTLSGTITGQDEFTGSLAATLSSPWTPVTGLTIASGALSASIARVAGATTFDVALSINGSWQPVPAVTVTQITARLTNRGAPPECAIDCRYDLGRNHRERHRGHRLARTRHQRDGASLRRPGTTQRGHHLDGQPELVEAGSEHRLHVLVGGPRPSPSRQRATGPSTSPAAPNFAGITLAGRARFTPLSGSFVLDAAGDLSALHLGPLSSGHVVFATVAFERLRPCRPGERPTVGRSTPIDLLPGLAAFADITLDTGMHAALDKIVNPAGAATEGVADPRVDPVRRPARWCLGAVEGIDLVPARVKA